MARRMLGEKRSLSIARHLLSDVTLNAKNATSFDWMFEVDGCTNFMAWISNTVVAENVITDDELEEYNAGLADGGLQGTIDEDDDELFEYEDVIKEEIQLLTSEIEEKKELVQLVKASTKKFRTELRCLEVEQAEQEQESQLADNNLIIAERHCLKAAQEFDESNQQIHDSFTRAAERLMVANKQMLAHLSFEEFKSQSLECRARALHAISLMNELTKTITETSKPDVIEEIFRVDTNTYALGLSPAAFNGYLDHLHMLNRNLAHLKYKEFIVTLEENSISTASNYLLDLLHSIGNGHFNCDPFAMQTELLILKEKLFESNELYKELIIRYLSCVSKSFNSKSAMLDECSIKKKQMEHLNKVAQMYLDCVSSQYWLGMMIYLFLEEERYRVQVASELWNCVAIANVGSEPSAAQKDYEMLLTDAASSTDSTHHGGHLEKLFHLPSGSSFQAFVEAALRLDTDIADLEGRLFSDNIEMVLGRIEQQRKSVEKLKRFILSGATMKPEYINYSQSTELYRCDQKLRKMQSDLKILIAKCNIISQEAKGHLATLKQNLWVLFVTDGSNLEAVVRNAFRKYN